MGRFTAGALAIVVLAAGGLSLDAGGSSVFHDTTDAALTGESACGSLITRTVTPNQVRDCERSQVDLLLRPECPGEPLNIALVLYAWAAPSVARLYRDWTVATVDALEMYRHPNVKVGIVYLRDTGRILLELTNNEQAVRDKSRVDYVDGTPPVAFPDLCYPCGFSQAAKVLRAAGRGERRVIVFIGNVEHPPGDPLLLDWVQGAGRAKAASDPFVVGCPWFTTCKDWSDWWREASPSYYFDGSSPGVFASAIGDLVGAAGRAKLTALSVGDEWPVGLALVPDSVVPPPAGIDPTSRRLRWDFSAPITRALTLTYQVQPQAVGVFTFSTGSAVLTDTQKQTRVLPLPTGVLTVTGPCEPPTATPTPVPPPTDTPSATSTREPPTASPTAQPPTPTPSPTATRAPRPVYLPLALRERCVPGQKRMDVVLVIDASTSMLQETVAGRSKLAAAQAAAGAFVGELRLDAGDQASIVAFNSEARVLQGLTADRHALDVALAGIAVAPTTRLDLAVEAAHQELASPRHRDDSAAVMIVLTDGKANPVGADAAVAKARAAKDARITIFTIGLGDDLDEWALAAIASKPAYFYHAADAEALKAIYEAIAVEIPCPADRYLGAR
jgi:uncharacterized protein YegL